MRGLVRAGVAAGVLLALAAWMLFGYPRPPDTTEARVFAGDGAAVDYCVLPALDGSGAGAGDIPKAYTPGCGWERWPMPVLAACTEPLAEGVRDLRGLWQALPEENGGFSHVERIEQCGNRTVVTASGIIHDFRTDDTLAHGARDVSASRCTNVWAAVGWDDGVMAFRPYGVPLALVSRRRVGEELRWTYPGLGEVRMRRICHVPEGARTREP